MVKRRDVLKLGLGVVGSGVLAKSGLAQDRGDLLKYLCPPDSFPDQLSYRPSPPAASFKAKLFVPPIAEPIPESEFLPAPVPEAHQRYEEFRPQKFYEIHQKEFRWQYHPDRPYSDKGGSLGWG